VRSDDLRGKQFSTHRRGYDKKQVDAFVEAAGLRLAAMESTERPAGPLVSGALLVGWAEWADSTRFSKPSWRKRGYEQMEVDAVLNAIRDTFLGVRKSPVRSDDVRGKQFSSTWNDDHDRYDKNQVAAFLATAGIRLAAMESTDRPARPLVNGAMLTEWAEWADSTRFSTTPRLREGYATAEVDAFRKELRDTFLGVSQPRPGSRNRSGPKRAWFSTTRGWSWPGYDVREVDAFLSVAKLRLAAITPDIEFILYRDA
jgi:DivIVA domain-containing protein